VVARMSPETATGAGGEVEQRQQSDGTDEEGEPDKLPSASHRIETGYGRVYVTVTYKDQEMFEVFVNTGNSGGYTQGWCEAVGKLATEALQNNTDPEDVAECLTEIRSDKSEFDNGDMVVSIPDAIGLAILREAKGIGANPVRGDAPGATPMEVEDES
jgi:ribonucleoside-diphosphate reductase alpha chain